VGLDSGKFYVLYTLGYVIALTTSIVVDVMAVAYLRRIFAYMSVGSSFLSVLRSVVGLIIVCIVLMLPYLYVQWTPHGVIRLTMTLSLLEATKMNLGTAAYCSIPVIIFIALLIHRALWPTLSRLLSPFYRFKLLNNQKAWPHSAVWHGRSPSILNMWEPRSYSSC
jgi:hypothetical protein